MANNKKVLGAVKRKVENATAEPAAIIDPLKVMMDNGNLIIGENCLLEGMVIYNHDFRRNTPNVTIGKDCHIMGQIELYSWDAKVVIGDRVFIGPQTRLFCRESINIENDVMVSWGCTIIDTNAHSLKSGERKDDVTAWKKGYQYKNWTVAETKTVNIKSKSWIGFNTIITKGVTIGEGGIVGCGSVVTKSTTDYSVVGGNPAAYIKDTI